MTLPAQASTDSWPSETSPTAPFEAVPPQNLPAEMAVLGGMMLSKEAIGQVIETGLTPDDFYRPAHAWIFQGILALYGAGEPADPITVAGELGKEGLLAKCGGASYQHTLVHQAPSAANAEYYAELVRDKAVRRRLRAASLRILAMADNEDGEIAEVLDAAGAEVLAVAVERADDSMLPLGHEFDRMLDAVEAAGKRKPGEISGIPTGYQDLDTLTDGLQGGQLIVVAARPAMGKTTAALDIARSASIKHGRPSIFFSLEMGRMELQQRILSAEGRIALHHLRTGAMTDDDWERAAKHSPKCTAAPLYIDDSPNLTMMEIRTKARRQAMKEEGLGLVVIDYLQLVKYGAGRPEARHLEVGEITRSSKMMAKELGIPVIALAQLNRGPEQRADHRPVVSDLRESGSVEQDADIVILIHREDAYEKDSPRAGEADLIVAKHRNGATAVITVAFQGHYSRFVDMAAT